MNELTGWTAWCGAWFARYDAMVQHQAQCGYCFFHRVGERPEPRPEPWPPAWLGWED